MGQQAETPGDSQTSNRFTFLVGVNKKRCEIDATSFAKVSTIFSNTINNIPPGSRRMAMLTDVEIDTFDALAQYVSTKDYTTPDAADHIVPSPHQIRNLGVDGQEAWRAARTSVDRMYTGPNQHYPDDKRDLKETLESHKSPSDQTHQPQRMQGLDMDFTPVFLYHAKLYFAGMRYSVDDLPKLALHKLCRTLGVWVDWYEVLSDLVALLKYVSDMTDSGDPMRDVLLDFVAVKFSDYQYHPDFEEFLEEYSEFSRELTVRIQAEKEYLVDMLKDYRSDYQ